MYSFSACRFSGDDLVYHAVLLGFFGCEPEVAVSVALYFIALLSGVFGQYIVNLLLYAKDLARRYFNFYGLPLGAAHHLMEQDLAVREREALAFGACREECRSHGRRDPDTDGRHRGLHILHGVVDRHACGYRPARRVDIEANVLFLILGLQKKQLGDHRICHRINDGTAQKDDPLLEEPRVDIVRPLPERGFLNHRGDEVLVDGYVSHEFILSRILLIAFASLESFSRKPLLFRCSSNTTVNGKMIAPRDMVDNREGFRHGKNTDFAHRFLWRDYFCATEDFAKRASGRNKSIARPCDPFPAVFLHINNRSS